MVQSQFSLSWDSYKSSICNGFSYLQQNGEFVDMTLAADGHLVKVHQVLMALASPYLKELVSSAPCQHPVIFLNNVTHRTLCLLLEYIYTGEVLVPAESLSDFVQTAKALHIKGLENITSQDDATVQMALDTPRLEDRYGSGITRMTVPTDDGSKQISIPASARKVYVKRQSPAPINPPVTPAVKPDISIKEDDNDFSDMVDEPTHDSDDDTDMPASRDDKSVTKEKASSNIQFSVSIRGSLQVILNRYIYNLHSTTTRSGIRRWRCVEYRNHKCMAFLVTKGSVVLNRANLHNHPFHDKKILAKIEKKAVYSALDDVQGYKEKLDKDTDNDTSMENYSLPDLNDDMDDTSDDARK